MTEKSEDRIYEDSITNWPEEDRRYNLIDKKGTRSTFSQDEGSEKRSFQGNIPQQPKPGNIYRYANNNITWYLFPLNQ